MFAHTEREVVIIPTAIPTLGKPVSAQRRTYTYPDQIRTLYTVYTQKFYICRPADGRSGAVSGVRRCVRLDTTPDGSSNSPEDRSGVRVEFVRVDATTYTSTDHR
jgi:hypothetical protein